MNNLQKLVIAWDLDGTLIDSSHRTKYTEDKKFDLEYWINHCTEEYIMKDKMLPLSDVFYEFQKTGFTQICVTARILNDSDYMFFNKHNLNFDLILHRENSTQLDHILKSDKLKSFFELNNYVPFMAYDDKEENLQVFDKYGFRTFQAIYMNEKLKINNYKDLTFFPNSFYKEEK